MNPIGAILVRIIFILGMPLYVVMFKWAVIKELWEYVWSKEFTEDR